MICVIKSAEPRRACLGRVVEEEEEEEEEGEGEGEDEEEEEEQEEEEDARLLFHFEPARLPVRSLFLFERAKFHATHWLLVPMWSS